MKTCCDCKQDKPLSDFHARKYPRTGYLSVCKPCQRIRWRIAQDRHRDGEVEQPDRSYIPPTDFLPLGNDVDRSVVLVWRIAA